MTTETPPKPRRRRTPRPHPEPQQIIVRKSSMAWANSLPSWVVMLVTLGATFISSGYTWATLQAQNERNREEIIRNEREDRERQARFDAQITQINVTIANMGQLRTDVEVMKNQLTAINDTLRRLERRLETVPAHAIVPATKPPLP